MTKSSSDGKGQQPSTSSPPPFKRQKRDFEEADSKLGENTSSSRSTMTTINTEQRSSRIKNVFQGFRDELDEHNDRRERLIKTSRDVTSLSKKLIFHLHRYDVRHHDPESNLEIDPPEQGDQGKEGEKEVSAKSKNPNVKLLREARVKLEEVVGLLRSAAEKEGFSSLGTDKIGEGVEQEQGACAEIPLNALRAQRYERAIGPGMEEFIEALSFYHYLRYGNLVSLQEVQARFRLKPFAEGGSDALGGQEGAILLPIPTSRYLLGLSDLTGELMRFATNAVGQGDTGKIVNPVLSLLRDIRNELDPFVPLIRDMKKKQSVTSQSVKKIEDVLYAIAVRSSEYGSDPQALQEMVRRTLSAGGGGGGREEEE
ncbi:Translin [Violaceomyces palustris]|uniref:Translin n=1 Tax=Violaceomyces palustris TaxID=1673888 RepID=A0ACD0NXI5_9BASI|nr:Translin [Violaceomyces palustris]